MVEHELHQGEADQLDIEFDSGLLENVDQETVGFLGVVGMSA